MKFYLILMLALCPGCKNAVYYAETDRFAITLEEKPDVAQPVGFNFGFKQRIVAVLPPKADPAGNKSEIATDSVSVISRFNFDYKDGPGLANPTLVQSALITGKAAKCLNDNQAAEAYKALSEGSEVTRTMAFTSISLGFQQMETAAASGEQPLAAAHVAAADADALRILSKLAPFTLRRWNTSADGKTGSWNTPSQFSPANARALTLDQAFTALANYRGNLSNTVAGLQAWAKTEGVDLDKPASTRPDKQDDPAEATRVDLWREARARISELSHLDGEIASAPGIVELMSAIQTYMRTGKVPARK